MTIEAEALTQQLVETHIASCIEIHDAVQKDGVTRFAWALNEMAEPVGRQAAEQREWSYEFATYNKAMTFAIMWLRQHRQDVVDAAKKDAIEGIRYRAYKAKKVEMVT